MGQMTCENFYQANAMYSVPLPSPQNNNRDKLFQHKKGSTWKNVSEQTHSHKKNYMYTFSFTLQATLSLPLVDITTWLAFSCPLSWPSHHNSNIKEHFFNN